MRSLFDPSVIERFWRLVHKAPGDDECWPWLGEIRDNGYGRFYIETDRPMYAHRASWQISNGVLLPKGEPVRHDCDNRPCARPDHLQRGTTADNNEDMVRRNRVAHGLRHWNRKLSATDLAEICRLLGAGETQRAIGERFNVNQSTISDIATRTTWRRDAPRLRPRG